MKIYISIINGEVNADGHTSLEGACKEIGVSVRGARNGKREWLRRNPRQFLQIQEINVIRIKGRGNKNI